MHDGPAPRSGIAMGACEGRTRDKFRTCERDGGTVPTDRARRCAQGLDELPSPVAQRIGVRSACAGSPGPGARFPNDDPRAVHRDGAPEAGADGGFGRTQARHVAHRAADAADV